MQSEGFMSSNSILWKAPRHRKIVHIKVKNISEFYHPTTKKGQHYFEKINKLKTGQLCDVRDLFRVALF